MCRRLLSLTIFKIDADARFRDSTSGFEGLGRSKNSKLGQLGDGFPNPRRQALGKPRMGPVVTGSSPLPPTNESRKVVVRDPGVKNFCL